MADVDLRRLRQFVTLADTLNYGRAAESLHIAQPALSRSIAAFERELGVRLFDRSRAGTTLTPAGELLRDEARTLLHSSETLHRRLLRADREGQSITVGFLPGTTVAPMIQHLEKAFPGIRVDGVRTSQADQISGLRDGHFDAGLAIRPFDGTGLTVVDLYAEPRAVILPADHRCAGKEEVTLADLAGEVLLHPAGGVGAVEELSEQVAAGRGVVLVPESAARFYHHPGLTWSLVSDAPHARICLVVESHRRSAVLDELLRSARAISGTCVTSVKS
ncbi:LysR family transcriptional regulator [Actinoplanes sp. LDG1-06]|uniref:LysR family transcriptional regulator n=1 Tax=Paractinoplanes ovalisporus TaxID=2810368 RepID=A0ABS2AGQ6_9ACTN|nr:LysR substrate-binding domain-containing protein [Actinoplanes ovalisporus]MBM2619020.1 LysR family transcriptional regulator [Actinoplanes ovalisporus]